MIASSDAYRYWPRYGDFTADIRLAFAILFDTHYRRRLPELHYRRFRADVIRPRRLMGICRVSALGDIAITVTPIFIPRYLL